MNPIFIPKPNQAPPPCSLFASFPPRLPFLTAKPAIRLGVDYLEETGFEVLKGKKGRFAYPPGGQKRSGTKHGRGTLWGSAGQTGLLVRSRAWDLRG